MHLPTADRATEEPVAARAKARELLSPEETRAFQPAIQMQEIMAMVAAAPEIRGRVFRSVYQDDRQNHFQNPTTQPTMQEL